MTDISYEWNLVEIEKGVPFAWGSKVTSYMKEHYSKPGVYRWTIWEGKHLRAAYIGEAERVVRRISQYLKPSGKESTDFRIYECLEKSAQKGFYVRLETIVIEPTYLNTIRILNENLSDPFLRRMIENFAITDTDVTQCELLNHVSNPFERRRSKAMKNNPFLDVLRQAGLDV